MNTPVSFELAKLLKEKGFDEKVKGRYCIKNIIPFKVGLFYLSDYELRDEFIYGPTIAETIMWLYEKHGIWIEVRHIKTFNVNRFHVIIWDYKDTSDYMTIHCDNGVGYEVWDSPTEAYEAAIEYTLNNLIK